MGLPTSYMTSVKRIPDIFDSIQSAKAPDTFSIRFLEALGFKSKGDRLIIGVLKDLNFLDSSGKATPDYFEYLDQSQSQKVMAGAIRNAWSDLFAVNVNAQNISKAEFVGKLKTLSQGQLSDRVIDNHFMTFSALTKLGDFSEKREKKTVDVPLKTEKDDLHNLMLKKICLEILIV